MPDAKLLERDREMAVLRELVAAAVGGNGQFIVIEGPAGIGKTRLLRAAREVAAEAGMKATAARSSELEREYSYGVVRQLFDPLLTHGNAPGRGDLLSDAAGQAAALFTQADAEGAGPASDTSFSTLHGLHWLTANLCARTPMALIIDDIQWADAPTLRFLAYLLLRMSGIPLVVVVGRRLAEPGTDETLIDQILTDHQVRTLRPAPLTGPASAQLVRSVLPGADEAFCAACHDAAGGNPLLVNELAEVVNAEGLEPVGDHAAHLLALGPRVVGQRVTQRLTRIGEPAVALCDAVAILGDSARLVDVAALAGADLRAVEHLARGLTDMGILQASSPTEGQKVSTVLRFVHPLVRSAIYDRLPTAALLDGHARAARLLADAGRPAENVAAHLLLVPPAGEPFAAEALQRAADEAFTRGSPGNAVAYLERCLEESPPPDVRGKILLQLGLAAQLVDVNKGADYLAAAMDAADSPERRIAIAEMRTVALQPAGRIDEAVEVIQDAISTLGSPHSDTRRRLEALLLGAMLLDPGLRTLATDRVHQLRSFDRGDGVGDGMLTIALAYHDALAGDHDHQDIVGRVRQGLARGALGVQANVIAVYACHMLIAADQTDVTALLERWVEQAYSRGSTRALAPAKCFSGAAWLARGVLTEARENLREAMWAATMTSQNLGRPVIASFLADTLIEQGDLDEAADVLDRAAETHPVPRIGYWYWFVGSRGRLLIRQGRVAEGLDLVMISGSRFAAIGGRNPALSPWRSDAALALLALDRQDEAQRLAAEELELARRWCAPGTLGRSLRVSGLVRGGDDGLRCLREAVDVLADSPAQLEQAKASIELGAALRRAGNRKEARELLRAGVELAQICGAAPLVKVGMDELRASGARLLDGTLEGLKALTPSERRVAELAAAGQSNRDIALALYVTVNTVEAHLTRTYRKLRIAGRAELSSRLHHEPVSGP